MKKLIFAMAAVVALAACSKEQTLVTPQPDAIGFGQPFIENATRATDPTYGTTNKLTKFNVYGTVKGTAGTVNIYDGVVVTGTVGTADWTHDAQYNQYWIPGADYSFAAVVDADAVAQDGYKMPTALTYNTAGQKDLLFATAAVDDAVANQGRVNFNFEHLLSKAQFTVTSNAMGGYYHSVTGITVSNFATGTYTIAYADTNKDGKDDGAWAGTTAKDIEFGNVTEVTAASGAKTNATQMLLVPNATQFNVTFTVELFKNGTKLGTETKTIPVDTDLVKGNSYNFTIACSVGNPIKFGVTNDPTWGDSTDVAIQ